MTISTINSLGFSPPMSATSWRIRASSSGSPMVFGTFGRGVESAVIVVLISLSLLVAAQRMACLAPDVRRDSATPPFRDVAPVLIEFAAHEAGVGSFVTLLASLQVEPSRRLSPRFRHLPPLALPRRDLSSRRDA